MKKTKSKRLKLCCLTLSRPLKRKMLLKQLGINPPKNPEKESRIHRSQGKERKQMLLMWETGTFQVEVA
jgi:hypothetical protein